MKVIDFKAMSEEEQKAYLEKAMDGKGYSDVLDEFQNLLAETGNERLLELAPVVLKAGRKGTPGKKREDSRQELFRKYMLEHGKAHEFDIFKEFRMGGHEVTSTAHVLRTKVENPEDIVWIQKETNSPDCEYYVLKGTGPEKPEDWFEKKRRKAVATPFGGDDNTEDDNTEDGEE